MQLCPCCRSPPCCALRCAWCWKSSRRRRRWVEATGTTKRPPWGTIKRGCLTKNWVFNHPNWDQYPWKTEKRIKHWWIFQNPCGFGQAKIATKVRSDGDGFIQPWSLSGVTGGILAPRGNCFSCWSWQIQQENNWYTIHAVVKRCYIL